MIDMKQVLRSPGLYSPDDLLHVIICLEDFLIDFDEIEKAIGEGCVSAGMLEYHIKNLREIRKLFL